MRVNPDVARAARAACDPARTVADAMLTDVKISAPGTTVRQLRALFENSKVHLAVVVDQGVLVGMVDRSDVGPEDHDDMLALQLGSLDAARVIVAGTALSQAWEALLVSGGRRLAVVASDGAFLGLLCLKRSRTGFCSNRDIRARAEERQLPAAG